MINIILDEKKTSVSIRYNAYFKLVILLAIINHCGSKNKAGLQLIHLMFWALRDENNYQILYDLKMRLRNSLTPWSFEFGLEKVLAIGYIENYIEKKIISKQLEIAITSSGLEILKSIENYDLFHDEINKIKEIGWIPKTKLQKANNNWKLL
ncbi:hypothetical protein [Formosa haliotis]|uniref:hypothetical protein n=1 Tax=Formosa haliotis TaxID=1555194 RepID=UPI0008259703|nr:hypothetical protein [Formosa haliotis]